MELVLCVVQHGEAVQTLQFHSAGSSVNGVLRLDEPLEALPEIGAACHVDVPSLDGVVEELVCFDGAACQHARQKPEQCSESDKHVRENGNNEGGGPPCSLSNPN